MFFEFNICSVFLPPSHIVRFTGKLWPRLGAGGGCLYFTASWLLWHVLAYVGRGVCVGGRRGEGYKEEEGVCVYNSVCVVSGGGGEECLVCADDDNMKGGEGWAQTDCASQNQTQTRFVSEFRPSLRHHTSVYRNKQASAASF